MFNNKFKSNKRNNKYNNFDSNILNSQVEQSFSNKKQTPNKPVKGDVSGRDDKQQIIDENNNTNINNNDDYFQNEYTNSQLNEEQDSRDGRISGGSSESAFSSAASDESDSFSSGLSCSNNQSLFQDNLTTISGRSSSSTTASQEFDVQNEKIVFLLETVRDQFGVNFLELNDKQAYDELDIEALMQPLNSTNLETHLAYKLLIRYCNILLLRLEFIDIESLTGSRFLDDNRDEIRKICDNFSELLKFRKLYQLNRVTIHDFPREFFQLNGIFTFGQDKENIPVLYISAHVHRKWSPKLDELFKRYVAWHVNRVTGSTLNPAEKLGHFVMCFDCDQIGYSNIDIEFLRFLVSLLLNYYPRFCKKCLIKDNPWVFRSIWSLVKTWLTDEARNAVQLITAKQLTEFIPIEQIPNSMRVNDNSGLDCRDITGRFKFPVNFDQMKTIDDFSDQLDMSVDEIRKLKSHVAKIEKEYRSLGAIV